MSRLGGKLGGGRYRDWVVFENAITEVYHVLGRGLIEKTSLGLWIILLLMGYLDERDNTILSVILLYTHRLII